MPEAALRFWERVAIKMTPTFSVVDMRSTIEQPKKKESIKNLQLKFLNKNIRIWNLLMLSWRNAPTGKEERTSRSLCGKK